MSSSQTRYVIIGTAGHVDHGKTTLIRALTGMETDRHPEERQRGMSIDLGFAHWDLPGDIVAGIVDVPGHERFVHNMLAGASEFDLALLLIAADEGVMPQSKEHLAILQLLNVKRGVIVITKIDTVTDDWLELVREEVAQAVQGTFLEDAPVVPVSAITGEGLDRLRDAVAEIARSVPPRDEKKPFRLPIDDVFVKAGFGTIVRGAIFSGSVAVGQEVLLQPSGRKARIRSLHCYGRPTNRAVAGQRAAMNLSGLKKEEIRRGDVVTGEVPLTVTQSIAVLLRLLPDLKKALKSGMQVQFHHGTAERAAVVDLLGRERLKAGEEAVAVFRLSKVIACAWGDRVIVRAFSPLTTIGGGTIVEMDSDRLMRTDRKRIVADWDLKSLDEMGYLISRINESPNGVTVSDMSQRLFLNPSVVQAMLSQFLRNGSAVPLTAGTVMGKEWLDRYVIGIVDQLTHFHSERPLRRGMSKESLRTAIGADLSRENFEAILKILSDQGLAVADGEVVRLATHSVRLTEEQESVARRIEQKCLLSGFTPPEIGELMADDPNGEQFGDIVNHLLETGQLVRVGDFLYHPQTIEKAKEVVKSLVKAKGSFTAAQFRDQVGASRKYVVPLLEYLDHVGFTVRIGDVRFVKG